jgi:cytochrome-b5 reductase
MIQGKETIRYYSPISRPDDNGLIELLIKVDANGGLMSNYLDNLQPGDTLDFKGPLGGLKLDIKTPGKIKRIGLIAGGCGIAPMIQIIRSVLHYKRHDMQIKLLYGAVNEDELVFKDLLEQKAKKHGNLSLYFTLDNVRTTEFYNV